MKPIVWQAGLALVLAVCARAENWPQWRGPFFNGSSTEAALPSQWSQTDNVAWAAALPGFSGATPVIWEDSVFVSSPDPRKNLLLICLERKTGQRRWEKVVAAGDRQRGRNNMASASPVTDGQRVFILFVCHRPLRGHGRRNLALRRPEHPRSTVLAGCPVARGGERDNHRLQPQA